MTNREEIIQSIGIEQMIRDLRIVTTILKVG